ncbi:MAG: kelch repeat-containing protein [Kofleriaceae bacterium]
MRGLWLLALGCGGSDAAPDDGATTDTTTACETTVPWASAPPLARGATQETATVATGGKLYILGGFDDAGNVIDAVQIFDPATCTYAEGPALPKLVHHANAATLDGTIYVLGSMQTGNFVAIPDTWSWNPETETTWTVRAPMPAGSQRGSAVAGEIDGKLYVAGGLRNGAVAEVSSYDPVADAWTAEAPLPAARDHGCGGALAGKLYVLGGRQAVITSNIGTVFEFTPGGAWVERTAMPTGRGGTGCGVVGDRFIVVGGEGNPDAATGVFPQVEAYTPATDTWLPLAPMVTPRHGMGAAAIGDRLYVPGGATTQGFGAVATHEILTP